MLSFVSRNATIYCFWKFEIFLPGIFITTKSSNNRIASESGRWLQLINQINLAFMVLIPTYFVVACSWNCGRLYFSVLQSHWLKCRSFKLTPPHPTTHLPLHPGKTTFKKPRLIRVKTASYSECVSLKVFSLDEFSYNLLLIDIGKSLMTYGGWLEGLLTYNKKSLGFLYG